MLDRVCGNAAVRQSLTDALTAGRLAHSVLLCAEKGCGVGFAAQCLAADYLFPAGGAAAETVLQNACPECLQLWPEGAGGQIKAEAVQRARRSMYDTSLSSEGRVLLIHHAEALNATSANALLKAMEEPPAGALFILAASSPAAVLPTIRSRCAQYSLGPAEAEACMQEVRRRVPRLPADAPSPEELCRVFEGRIGTVLAILQDAARRKPYLQARQLAAAAAKRDEYALLALLAGWEKDRAGAVQLLEDFCALAADALRRPQPGFAPHSAARDMLHCGEALRALRGYVNPKLVLTNLGIRLARG